MSKYIDTDKSYDIATLTDWYINSVTDDPPIWTEEHLEELLNDFYVIPKDTPAADAVSLETHEAVQKALIAFAETDVVQVVKCKDCIHCKKNWTGFVCGNVYAPFYSDEYYAQMNENDFCSYGERAGENND